MKSKAFVFEGLDFTGKTTVSQYCFDKLKTLYGPDVVLYRSPGGTPLGEKVRDIARIEAKTVYEQTFAYLTGLSSVLEQVEKDLENGKIVLLDRWFQSLQAYQILQITDDSIRTALNTAATLLANKVPVDYFLFEVNFETMEQRLKASTKNDTLDRFEASGVAYRKTIYDNYKYTFGHLCGSLYNSSVGIHLLNTDGMSIDDCNMFTLQQIIHKVENTQ